MRNEFVECDTIEEAVDACPWAVKVIAVEGGFKCFESHFDFSIWALNCMEKTRQKDI